MEEKLFDLSKIEYIDTHSHLQFKSYDENREEVINRMLENKVATICIGVDLKESEEGKKLALKYENIFYSVALHPYDNLDEAQDAFENEKEYFEKLKSIADNEKCVAIGECGLDYFYIYKEFADGKITEEKLKSEIEKQKKIFRAHINLAIELNLPLMLHIRPSELNGNKEDAYLYAIEILKEYKNIKGNFHFFVGTENVLEKILNELENFTVSIPAVCTFTTEYDEMIKNIPLNKIHIETDSPFVMPKPRRKEAKQNEPSFVIDVFHRICEIKEITSTSLVTNKEEFKNILKENFKNLYLTKSVG
jgi:TatD DNase family protein